jgi:hypothetical protein
MSNTEASLEKMTGALAAKVKDSEDQINAARGEIVAADASLEKVQQAARQTEQDLAAQQKIVASLPDTERDRRQQLVKSIAVLEEKQHATASQLQAAKQARQDLLAKSKEEHAGRELRKQQSLFVVEVDGLFSGVTDGAVRYLFADQALAACDARKITPDIFDDASSQKIIGDVLARLRNARAQTSDSDRKEAQLYGALTELRRDASSYRTGWSGRVAADNDRLAKATNTRSREQATLAELSAPETEQSKASRRSKKNWGIALAVVSILIAIAAFILVPPDAGLIAAVVAVVAAVACLLFAWSQGDKARARQLADQQDRFKRSEDDIETIRKDRESLDQEAQSKMGEFGRRLQGANTNPPAATGVIEDDLKALVEAAERTRAAWRARHSDIRLVDAG